MFVYIWVHVYKCWGGLLALADLIPGSPLLLPASAFTPVEDVFRLDIHTESRLLCQSACRHQLQLPVFSPDDEPCLFHSICMTSTLSSRSQRASRPRASSPLYEHSGIKPMRCLRGLRDRPRVSPGSSTTPHRVLRPERPRQPLP